MRFRSTLLTEKDWTSLNFRWLKESVEMPFLCPCLGHFFIIFVHEKCKEKEEVHILFDPKPNQLECALTYFELCLKSQEQILRVDHNRRVHLQEVESPLLTQKHEILQPKIAMMMTMTLILSAIFNRTYKGLIWFRFTNKDSSVFEKLLFKSNLYQKSEVLLLSLLLGKVWLL
jgi:hypothetical protein